MGSSLDVFYVNVLQTVAYEDKCRYRLQVLVLKPRNRQDCRLECHGFFIPRFAVMDPLWFERQVEAYHRALVIVSWKFYCVIICFSLQRYVQLDITSVLLVLGLPAFFISGHQGWALVLQSQVGLVVLSQVERERPKRSFNSPISCLKKIRKLRRGKVEARTKSKKILKVQKDHERSYLFGKWNYSRGGFDWVLKEVSFFVPLDVTLCSFIWCTLFIMRFFITLNAM